MKYNIKYYVVRMTKMEKDVKSRAGKGVREVLVVYIVKVFLEYSLSMFT